MLIEQLSAVAGEKTLGADVVIVGGGPAGLTVAAELETTGLRVLVLESGGDEATSESNALNEVGFGAGEWSAASAGRRSLFHGENAPLWSHAQQTFGVRYRGLGGSSQAWAGKCAAFDDIDGVDRSWVPLSGWPVSMRELKPFIERAGRRMNLGPHVYDDTFWEAAGAPPPQPSFDPTELRSFFWQFARSPSDTMDFLRFGKEFRLRAGARTRVLLNATVTSIRTDADGREVIGVEAAAPDGARTFIGARFVVLAASAIENARLLLVSGNRAKGGLANPYDVVGRHLCDHPGARIGHFSAVDAKAIVRRFGFYGLARDGRSHMYMHGLALGPERQAREKLLNGALYMLENRAPDDPLDALKRLVRRKSANPGADLLAVVSAPGLLAAGLGAKILASGATPARVRDAIVDLMIRLNPNMVVREHLNRGMPHKLDGVWLDAITEQAPDPANRVRLSIETDRFGMPKPIVDWRVGDAERWTLIRLGQIFTEQASRTGLPAPQLEDWVARGLPSEAVFIDMGHTSGVTRMSSDPRQGVVDPTCRVHGVGGLYVAGASVFPTSGHANPTLMIVSLAIRLADEVKRVAAQRVGPAAGTWTEPAGANIL